MARTLSARFAMVLMTTLLALSWWSPGQGSGGIAQAAGPRQPAPFVLGMGDSVGWGYQAFPVDPNTTYPGFVNRFAERLASSPRHRVITVNYSCNGESTGSLIAGVESPAGLQCAGKALYDSPAHDDYNSAQLDAAVAFLRRQTGEGIVLLNIGGNDPLDNPTVVACNFDFDCWTEAFQKQEVRDEMYTTGLNNYKTILSTLLTANSRVRILAVNIFELDDHDPFTATGIVGVLNAALAEAIAEVGSPRVMLVDTTATFTPQAICADGLTEWCFAEGPFQSAHPSDAGYVTLTNLACDASRESTTRENHLTCRPDAHPKPGGHGKPKPGHPRPGRWR